MLFILPYKKLLETKLYLSLQGSVSKDRYVYRVDTNCGMLYVSDAFFPDPAFKLNQRTCNTPTYCCPGKRLHVSSECKTKRDVFRNSGYQLKRNPENADFVVIPDIPPTFRTFRHPIILESNDEEQTVTLIEVDLDDCYFRNDRKKCMDVICEEIRNTDIWANATIHINLEEEFLSWMIPYCEEYKDIFEGNSSFSYIKETQVPLKPGSFTKITPEVLDIWMRCKDVSVLDGSICSSDWAKYPVTMLVFLKNHKENMMRERLSSNFRMMLRTIKYDMSINLSALIQTTDIVVSPDDWAMLQGFIAYELHLQDGKGWLPMQWNDFIMKYLPFIRSKIAVSTTKIDKPTQLVNICN